MPMIQLMYISFKSDVFCLRQYNEVQIEHLELELSN